MPTLCFCSPKVGLSLAKGLKLNSLTLGGQFRRWAVGAAFLLLIPLPLPAPPPLPTTLGQAAWPSLCPQTTQVPMESCEGLVADLSLVTLCSTLRKKTLHDGLAAGIGLNPRKAPQWIMHPQCYLCLTSPLLSISNGSTEIPTSTVMTEGWAGSVKSVLCFVP